MLSRVLHDITQLLESADGADQRVTCALTRLRDLVPYDQCGVLEARLGYEPRLWVTPEPAGDERARLSLTLMGLFEQLVDAPVRSAPATRGHLAVPMVGLDEVIGLLFVRSSSAEFKPDHLRALSLVAALLGAYFTQLRASGELAALARERDEARRVAEDANRAKDEFLTLVSHELKTPLSSILASTHLLRSAAEEGARARALDEVDRNVHVQSRLVDDILDLACVASAELRLQMRTVEPAALIKKTLEALRLEAERKAVRLREHLDDEAMPLVLDPDRIGQVLSTLVSNAIQFTPAGGYVEVRLQRATGIARIQVSDGGARIGDEALPRVFDRFPPAARADAPAGGRLGFGLALAKDLVELHGGRVRADSDPQRPGMTFTIELPRLQAPMRPDGRLLSGIRVLLVDHDPGLRESFQQVLAEYGADVTSAADAPDALAALERSRPDVVLFGDLAMHGDGAYDLVREVTVRACPPIVSISAWRSRENERERASNFRMHLAKPLEIDVLINTVADLAKRARS